jgi:hypothetical protein
MNLLIAGGRPSRREISSHQSERGASGGPDIEYLTNSLQCRRYLVVKRHSAFFLASLSVLLVWVAVVASGCGGNVPASLDYDNSQDKVVVEYRSGGGLPAPWDDTVADFRLFGDGTMIRTDPASKQLVLIRGQISEEEMKGLLEKIAGTGFFGLKDEYVNKKIFDGTSQDITVNLKEGKKKVHVYMMDVKEFNATRDLLMDYRTDQVFTDYVPEKGYLVVQKSTGGQKVVVGPSSGIFALLPDAAALKQAAEGRKPIAVDGAAFAKIKRFEAPQQYAGFAVQAEGVTYDVFPVYIPRFVK